MGSYPDYYLIPSICFAAYIETQARIVLSRHTLPIACDQYLPWLRSVTQGTTDNQLDTAAPNVISKINELRKKVQPGNYSCVVASHERDMDPSDPSRVSVDQIQSILGNSPFWSSSFTRHSTYCVTVCLFPEICASYGTCRPKDSCFPQATEGNESCAVLVGDQQGRRRTG